MPRFDKTGPMGMGPMTGRGMGSCGWGMGWNRGQGKGYGRGLGRFFGWGAPQNEQEQKEALEDYLKALKEEIEDVQKQLQDLG